MKLKVDFAGAPIEKLILQLSYPSIIAMLVSASYNFIDGIFLGQFIGPEALGATNAAFPLTSFFMALATMAGVGLSSVISRSLGSKRERFVLPYIGNSIVGALLMGIIIFTFGLLFGNQLLSFAGAAPEIFRESQDYFYGQLIGWLYYPLVVIGNNLLRSIGEAKKASSLMIFGIIVNVILVPIFILVFKLGIWGVGIATSIAQGSSLILLFIYVKQKVFPFAMEKSHFKLDFGRLFRMYSYGVSSFLRQTINSVTFLIYNRFLLMYGGVDYLNAMGIINKLYTLVILPIFGLLQGVQPVTGFNFGARNFKRVRESVYKGAFFCFLISFISMVVILTFRDPILSIFTNDANVLSIARDGVFYVFICLPLISIQMVGTSTYQAFGKVLRALFIALVRQLIIGLPLLFFLAKLMGIQGIWISFPLADVLSALVSAIIIEVGLRKIKKSWES